MSDLISLRARTMHRALLACWDRCRSCFFRGMASKNQRTLLQQRQCNCQHDCAFSRSRSSSKSNQKTKLTCKHNHGKSVRFLLVSLPFPSLSVMHTCHLPWTSSGMPSLHSKLNQFTKMEGETLLWFFLNQAELAGISIRQKHIWHNAGWQEQGNGGRGIEKGDETG